MTQPKKTVKLDKALLKKALGYQVKEVVEEYIIDKEDQDKLVLHKKKVTKKDIPPDMTAFKTLLQLKDNHSKTSFENLTDEQLEKEKTRLIKMLKADEKGEKNATRKN